MKISFNTIKYTTATILSSLVLSSAAQSQNRISVNDESTPDTFVKVSADSKNPVDKYTQNDLPRAFREATNPSSWTNDPKILKMAPNPYFYLKGYKTMAKIVVDITNCRLYIYNDSGNAVESFKVAVGAFKTPTRPGIRKVLAKQTFPYTNCPKNSKRYRFPRDYGPKIAYLNVVDTITGNLHDNGAYFHGTRHESSILRQNRHLTHSCTRVHNRDALYIINDVLKIGDYLKYIKK